MESGSPSVLDKVDGVLKPQVATDLYYRGQAYISPARFASYAYQIKEVLELQPRRVLEVGIGNGLVSYMLRKAGLDVTTLDFDPSLEPEIVASVTDMPVPHRSFDVVACFEVLEHLPFDRFPKALRELRRASCKHVVLTLPDCTRIYKLEARLPKLGRRRFSFGLRFLRPSEHEFDGQHYWEIGRNGYPLKTVRECLEESGLQVIKTYRVWENVYHRMFVTRLSQGQP